MLQKIVQNDFFLIFVVFAVGISSFVFLDERKVKYRYSWSVSFGLISYVLHIWRALQNGTFEQYQYGLLLLFLPIKFCILMAFGVGYVAGLIFDKENKKHDVRTLTGMKNLWFIIRGGFLIALFGLSMTLFWFILYSPPLRPYFEWFFVVW